MQLLKTVVLNLFHNFGYDIIKYKSKIGTQALHPEALNLNWTEVKKIHYACGPNYLKGWLNVDLWAINKRGYLSATVDLTKRHPFPEGQFEFGFAEDFIEHLGQSEQIIFLCEVFRTFKEGGVLRLSFPGLEGVLNRYYNSADYLTTALAKYEAYEKWGHIHFLSKDEFRSICKHIGFREFNPVSYGISTYETLRNLDTRIMQTDLNTYVEIIK